MTKTLTLTDQAGNSLLLVGIPEWTTHMDIIPRYNYLRVSNGWGSHTGITLTERYQNVMEIGKQYELLGAFDPYSEPTEEFVLGFCGTDHEKTILKIQICVAISEKYPIPYCDEPEKYPDSQHEMRACTEWKQWAKNEPKMCPPLFAVILIKSQRRSPH